MNLKFGLDELATEGEHAARIVAVKELGIVKGQFRSEEVNTPIAEARGLKVKT
jgi:hypothetical protein